MKNSLEKIRKGYETFRKAYTVGDHSVMHQLAAKGQKPEVMVVACCDSRVDPSVILQSDPGDLFVVRNVANIVPPYESDDKHHGTSAALEFGICYLQVKHLIILGHSQCGGIHALLHEQQLKQNDFITHWVSLIDFYHPVDDVDLTAKRALTVSYENCLTFPWINVRLQKQLLQIHRWFFDIKSGEIFCYNDNQKKYEPLI